jgi:hypothetical protein
MQQKNASCVWGWLQLDLLLLSFDTTTTRLTTKSLCPILFCFQKPTKQKQNKTNFPHSTALPHSSRLPRLQSPHWWWCWWQRMAEKEDIGSDEWWDLICHKIMCVCTSSTTSLSWSVFVCVCVRESEREWPLASFVPHHHQHHHHPHCCSQA